jgi:hypothetical protein
MLGVSSVAARYLFSRQSKSGMWLLRAVSAAFEKYKLPFTCHQWKTGAEEVVAREAGSQFGRQSHSLFGELISSCK